MMLVISHDAGHNETDEGSDGRVLAFEVVHEMVKRSQGKGGEHASQESDWPDGMDGPL
jgi:hypothetical protein